MLTWVSQRQLWSESQGSIVRRQKLCTDQTPNEMFKRCSKMTRNWIEPTFGDEYVSLCASRVSRAQRLNDLEETSVDGVSVVLRVQPSVLYTRSPYDVPVLASVAANLLASTEGVSEACRRCAVPAGNA